MLCAGETGTMSWRHPPHRAGVASHAALESGVVVRAGARDALTEAGAGGVVSRAMATRWGADLVTGHGRPQPLPRHARGRGDLARSEPPARPPTPCTGPGKPASLCRRSGRSAQGPPSRLTARTSLSSIPATSPSRFHWLVKPTPDAASGVVRCWVTLSAYHPDYSLVRQLERAAHVPLL